MITSIYIVLIVCWHCSEIHLIYPHNNYEVVISPILHISKLKYRYSFCSIRSPPSLGLRTHFSIPGPTLMGTYTHSAHAAHACTHMYVYAHTCTHMHMHTHTQKALGWGWPGLLQETDRQRKRHRNADKCKIISLEPMNRKRGRAHGKYESHESLQPGKGIRGCCKRELLKLSAPCTERANLGVRGPVSTPVLSASTDGGPPRGRSVCYELCAMLMLSKTRC